MKILSSSSSVASTGTAAATSGCLAPMLRRLLCFNSLPTHPDNQSKDNDWNSVEFDKVRCLETEEMIGDTANPGIVARLMGLELMPPIEFSNNYKKPSSVTRSRSMNCDSLIQGQHRRAKISLSFREMPKILEHEEFFVLSFENLGTNNEFRSKGNRSEAGGGGISKRRKAEKCRRKCEREESVPEEVGKETQESSKRINHKLPMTDILPPEVSNRNLEIDGEAVEQLKLTSHKEKCNEGKQRGEENVSEVKKAETECNSENSSPVSVLDYCESIFRPLVPTPEGDASCKGSNSRRKLSTELENYEHSSPRCEPSNSTSDIHMKKMIHGKFYESRGQGCQRETNLKMWGEICKIAESEMMEPNWVKKALWKLEDCRDIGVECEKQILQELLNEAVDHLVETPGENFDM